MKRICVTGGNGLLGSKILTLGKGLYQFLAIDQHDCTLVQDNELKYEKGDITRRDSIYEKITRFQPDCIIHTAAFTNVDGCELDKEKAWQVNVQGTENVARACRDLNSKMIHISTDYVFDGKSGPYSETDECHPISVYGKTKLESENCIKILLKDFIIARTMVLYGFYPGVRLNFVTWLIQSLKDDKVVSIVSDQNGTPTLADDLAKNLLALYELNAGGLYHTAGCDLLNRYDFALVVADIFHFDKKLIQKTDTQHLQQPAPRPINSGLKIDKIYSDYGLTFSSVNKGLNILKAQIEESE